ncbi:hypothetical protein RCH06_003136 [Polaromonas sp. CG_9.5]|uniref:hypothetical protein n=1 Tax=Polaromonas sp. CG_9.5 TaxID=3071705 RepID=UPI002E017EF8|nr:hypothetical protein [Polaromonas sp. CG_9.5]
MKSQSQPLPGLHLTRAQWRCLRVVSEVRDIAHAARKLHWSQALLKSALADLHACVGGQHIALSDKQVQLSPTLKHLIDKQPVCGRSGALARPDGLNG